MPQHDSDANYVYGFHTILVLLEKSPYLIQVIFIQKDKHDQRLQQLLKLATEHDIAIQKINKEKLDKLSDTQNHQGVIAQVAKTKNISENLEEFLEHLKEPAFLLILDGVQDPHNLGACLRSANAAGVHAVIAPKDRAVGVTPVVRKVASGAAELTPFFTVTNLARTINDLKNRGIWVFGATEHTTESLFAMDLTGPIAIVLGAEGSGLRRLTTESCDKIFCIPTVGEIKSLNVSVAAGVCLFEALRQRIKK